MSDSELSAKSEPVRRSEVSTGAGSRRRRRWSAELKARIIAESYAGGETVRAVAQRNGLTPQQLYVWRRHARQRAEGRPLENDAASARMIVTVQACEGRSEQSQPAATPGTPAIEIAIWRQDGACAFRLVLVAKRRRRQGSFRWPTISDGVMRLTSVQLAALLGGLDWTRLRTVGVRASQATL